MSKLRVAIDCRLLKYEKGGIYRIIYSLIHYLKTNKFANVDFFLIADKYYEELSIDFPSNVTIVQLRGPAFLLRSYTATTLLLLPINFLFKNMDCLFVPYYFGPIFHPFKKLIISPWDISYSTHPNHYGLQESLLLRFLSYASSKMSHMLVTCSQYDKNVISTHYKINLERIYVLELAVDDVFRQYADSKVDLPAAFAGINKKQYILCPGTIYNRRNIDVFIKAFARFILVSKKELSLVLFGRNYTNPFVDVEGLATLYGIQDHVHQFDRVSDSEIIALYKNAYATYCTSTVDGESINIKESLILGSAVITNNNFAESIGGYCLIVEDPSSVESVFESLCTASDSLNSLVDTAINGCEYVKGIVWSKSFDGMFARILIHE